MDIYYCYEQMAQTDHRRIPGEAITEGDEMIFKVFDNLITEEANIVSDYTRYWTEYMQENEHCVYVYVGF